MLDYHHVMRWAVRLFVILHYQPCLCRSTWSHNKLTWFLNVVRSYTYYIIYSLFFSVSRVRRPACDYRSYVGFMITIRRKILSSWSILGRLQLILSILTCRCQFYNQRHWRRQIIRSSRLYNMYYVYCIHVECRLWRTDVLNYSKSLHQWPVFFLHLNIFRRHIT